MLCLLLTKNLSEIAKATLDSNHVLIPCLVLNRDVSLCSSHSGHVVDLIQHKRI